MADAASVSPNAFGSTIPLPHGSGTVEAVEDVVLDVEVVVDALVDVVVDVLVEVLDVAIEICGEPGLSACGTGQLCVGCRCRQMGDCQNDGGAPNLFDVLEALDIILERQTADANQMILCNVDCDTDIDLLDVLETIDVVLQRIPPPPPCPN